MLITIEKESVLGIPILHIYKQELKQNQLPLIMFFHGFSSAKEHNLDYAYLLAEKGFRVILPDALYHGERDPLSSLEELNFKFWEVVISNIHDVDTLKDVFVKNELAKDDSIGIAGTSMGAITTLGALVKYPWLTAGVSLMGTAYYEDYTMELLEGLRKSKLLDSINENEINATLKVLNSYDPSKHLSRLNQRPLLLWHGKFDNVVPFFYSEKLHNDIAPLYDGHSEKLKFIIDENARHKVSRQGKLATVSWFSQFLN